jgi:hypothetical protein
MKTRRLGCGAVVALLSGLLPASGDEVARPAHWVGKRGTERTVLAVAADQGVGLLLIRCARGRVAVSVDWARYVGSAPIPVSMRIGDAQSRPGNWLPSTNLRETVYPGDSIALLESLRAGGRLSVEVKAAREMNVPFSTPTLDGWLAGRVARVEPPAPIAAEEVVSVGFDLAGLGRVLETDGADCQAP